MPATLSFNTPDAVADALAKTGFNPVNLATNHVLDYGVEAAERSLDVWDAYPGIACAGSYRSQADRETVRLVERNGMTFAFLAFCYGDNYFQEDLPDTWHLCGFDKAAIELADVRRAQQVADAVIVAMHWGTEYESEPDGQQLDYAAFLADLDVDLVLGTHAHTVQPVRLVQGASGNAVPVVFGLGDLVSGWGKVDYILSGLFTCDFVRVYDEAGTDGGSGRGHGTARRAWPAALGTRTQPQTMPRPARRPPPRRVRPGTSKCATWPGIPRWSGRTAARCACASWPTWTRRPRTPTCAPRSSTTASRAWRA